MSVAANVLGNWKTGKLFVNVGGNWKLPVAWVKDNGAWRKVQTAPYTYVINTNRANFNLVNNIGLPPYDEINVIINPGVQIFSTSTGIPAFNLGNPYTGKRVNIINYGIIRGKGGAGGGGGSAGDYYANNGGAGAAGGTALYVRQANKNVYIDNRGQINGGGGGGGGGGAVVWNLNVRLYGQGGRGGNGADGIGRGAGGAGGSRSSSRGYYAYGGNGGQGGNPGSAGGGGGNGAMKFNYSGCYARAGGARGRAGYAIDGNSRVNYTSLGSVAGPRVN